MTIYIFHSKNLNIRVAKSLFQINLEPKAYHQVAVEWQAFLLPHNVLEALGDEISVTLTWWPRNTAKHLGLY